MGPEVAPGQSIQDLRNYWLNLPEVQQALHVRNSPQLWVCFVPPATLYFLFALSSLYFFALYFFALQAPMFDSTLATAELWWYSRRAVRRWASRAVRVH